MGSSRARLLMVLALTLVVGQCLALPLGLYSDWYFHEEECRDIAGNRDLYEEVARVCNDCQNIFRSSKIGAACRKDCFWNEEFKLCVHALQQSAQLPEYMRKIHIIKVG